MGDVYRARDTRLGRPVAIKILRTDITQSAEHRSRFEREARIISSLDHPHICRLYDVGRQNGVDYLVMAYVEGESMARRLEKGPLPLEQVFRYGVEIADAIAAAHGRGIIHRDLKPGNIVLAKSGAVVLDFGLAKLWAQPRPTDESETVGRTAEPMTQGTIIGTLNYMAPEQFEGKKADPRCDLFAFGCLLYEMATGRKAFEGRNAMEVMAAIVRSQPPRARTLNPVVPQVLDHIIQRCLAKDPDERWQSAQDIREELKWARGTGAELSQSPAKRSRTWPAWTLEAIS